jgi:hypothetical protein
MQYGNSPACKAYVTGWEAVGLRISVASLITIVEVGKEFGFATRVIVGVVKGWAGEAGSVAEGEVVEETGVRVKIGTEGFVILGSYLIV